MVSGIQTNPSSFSQSYFRLTRAEFVYQAFRIACEQENGDGGNCILEQSGKVLTVRNAFPELQSIIDLFAVDWPEVKILNNSLTTVRILVRALNMLQVEAEGQFNLGCKATLILKLHDGVLQCFPVAEGVVIDIEKKRARYDGSSQNTKLVDAFSRLNDLFLNAAAKYGQSTADALYNCLLFSEAYPQAHPEDFPELEGIMSAATTLARKRLWFVKFQGNILAKVRFLDFFKEKEKDMYILVTSRGISKPKVAKKPQCAAAGLVKLLWELACGERRSRYSWRDEKSAELLRQFIETAMTVDVAGREHVINKFVKSLPKEARIALLREVV